MDVLEYDNKKEKNIKLTINEVRDVMRIVQNYQSLKIVKNIIEFSPERIEQFGFDESDFYKLESELKEADKKCRNWWSTISNKYDLPNETAFHINYNTCILTIK